MMLFPKITLIHPDAQIPTHNSDYAAGYDIYCVSGLTGIDLNAWPDKQLAQWEDMDKYGNAHINPGQRFLFRTGICQQFSEEFCCLLWDKSGLAVKNGLHLLAGVLDADYTGEIFVSLLNTTDQEIQVREKSAIAQMIYQKRAYVEYQVVENFSEQTTRGTGGFGSTTK